MFLGASNFFPIVYMINVCDNILGVTNEEIYSSCLIICYLNI